MADPQALAAAILTALHTLPGTGGVYDGYVPEKVPETDGYIDPYVVLWAGTGELPREQPADGRELDGPLVWDFQTTAVGASPDVCRTLDQAVTALLKNMLLGTGRVRRNPDGFNQQAPLLDTQVSPSRFYLPRQWRLITN